MQTNAMYAATQKKGSPETNAKTPTQEEITECKLTLCNNPETNAETQKTDGEQELES